MKNWLYLQKKAVRSTVLTILASLFLFSATELHQLVKLPELLRHYREHCGKGSDMSFLGFLQLHYSANHPQDNDEEDDNQLPFKEIKVIGHVDNTVSMHRYENRTCPEFLILTETITHPEGMPCYRANAVFHPPKS